MGGDSRGNGVDERDDLKDFHQTMAVQATGAQSAQYATLITSTEAASREFRGFSEQLGPDNKSPNLSPNAAALDQAVEKARSENKNFLDGLSQPQKSGLKEIIRNLEKADLSLAEQSKALQRSIEDKSAQSPQIAVLAGNLEKALSSFYSQQLSLGKEMSIVLPGTSQEIAFNIPPVKASVNIENQPIAISTFGVISRVSAENGQNILKLEMTADLSDLQQNITAVLRSRVDRYSRCGERIAIQEAALTPLAPASLVVARVHFERWACPKVFGRENLDELVEGNGTVEVKLTPVIDKDGTLKLVPEVRRIDAEGLLGELLRSGALGDSLREKMTQSLLSAMQKGTDLKTTLPAAVQDYATIQKVQFEDAGAEKLSVVLDGEIRISNEQINALASQLKERVSAQGTLPQ
jgi:hypothetical protein